VPIHCLDVPKRASFHGLEGACVQVRSGCNRHCFGFDYEWKRVGKGVLKVRTESLNDEH